MGGSAGGCLGRGGLGVWPAQFATSGQQALRHPAGWVWLSATCAGCASVMAAPGAPLRGLVYSWKPGGEGR